MTSVKPATTLTLLRYCIQAFLLNDLIYRSIEQISQRLFENIPKIRRILQTLCDVGLEYLTLGQSAPTLSGGEAQRVKLALELSRRATGSTLYVLDEPMSGLDPVGRRDVRDIILAQAKAGTEGTTAGASATSQTGKQAKAKYRNGMGIFVHTKGGLMYEAAIGGQKFSFEPK